MQHIELSAGIIEYEDTGGSGPVIVLLHGLLMNGAVWRQVVGDLRSDYRCLIPTLPVGGHRQPIRAEASLSLHGLARLQAEFLEALDLREVTLVGNDLSAFLVTADSYPERLARLVITWREALLRGTERATRLALTRNPLLLTLRNALAPIFFSSLPGAAHRMAEALSEISIAYSQSPIVVDSRDKKGTLRAGDRAPNALVRASGGAEASSLFEIFKSPHSILLVLAGRQEADAVERHWREIEALLSRGIIGGKR